MAINMRDSRRTATSAPQLFPFSSVAGNALVSKSSQGGFWVYISAISCLMAPMYHESSLMRWLRMMACVKRIYTELCTLECTPQGLRLIDSVDGLSHAELERMVGLPIAAAAKETL